jgi:hypothetical protein
MKLTKAALDKIKNPKIRIKLAIALGVTDQSIQNYIKDNKDELTKAAALEVIRKETGLRDSEILEKQIAA